MEKLALGAALSQSLLERLASEILIGIRRGVPAHHSARVEVEQDGQVEVAPPTVQEGDVSDPNPIRLRRLEATP